MGSSERGMALVSVLFLLALFLALGTILSDKILHSIQTRSRSAVVERSYWAAAAGIEWGRQRLGEHYQASGGWRDYLAGTEGPHYSAAPCFTIRVDDIPVRLYVRDNPDGDQDFTRDNDLQVYLLAQADAGTGGETRIESLCRLDSDQTGAGYAQWQRGGVAKTGSSPYDATDSGSPQSRRFDLYE